MCCGYWEVEFCCNQELGGGGNFGVFYSYEKGCRVVLEVIKIDDVVFNSICDVRVEYNSIEKFSES